MNDILYDFFMQWWLVPTLFGLSGACFIAADILKERRLRREITEARTGDPA